MAPVIPDPHKIHSFPGSAEFEAWLRKNFDKQNEIWLRIFKKGTGKPTVTNAEAVDVVLCWGWIDGIRKSYDEVSYLQRFSPRKPKSIWSQVNREHIQRLIDTGRMTEHGLRHVEAAKADGRWDAAYAPGSKMEVPEDLRAAIAGNPQAEATFKKLNKQNLFALSFRVGNMRTEAGRRRKIENFVEMLARGEMLHPNGRKIRLGE